jgi:hypothetical protein
MPGQINGSTNGAARGTAQNSDKLPKDLVDEMQRLFGKHSGYRTSTSPHHRNSPLVDVFKRTPKVSS